MVDTVRIDLITNPLTVMDKEVYDPTGREGDIFAAVDLKLNIAGPTFTGVLTAPAGSVTEPSIQGPQGQGIHFGTNLVNIDCEDLNVWRSGKDTAIQTVDTHLIQARTPGSAGHGYPQLALRCMDTATPSGAGPFIRFQSYNSAGELLECSVNAGLVDATDGAEDGGWDFSVYRAGVSEVAWAISGYEAMVGPTVDNAYDLGRASYRLKAGYFGGPVQLGVYAKAALPSASAAGKIIYVSDDTGGAVLAFSDGTNWRRVTDRNVIS